MGKTIANCVCCGVPGISCDACTLPSEYYFSLESAGIDPTLGSHFTCNGTERCNNLIGTYLLSRVSELYHYAFRFDPELNFTTSPISYFVPLRGLSQITTEGILYQSDIFNLCNSETLNRNIPICPDANVASVACNDGYRLILFFPTRVEWLDRGWTTPSIGSSDPCYAHFGLWNSTFLDAELKYSLLGIGGGSHCETALDSITGLDLVLACVANGYLRNAPVANRFQLYPNDGMCNLANSVHKFVSVAMQNPIHDFNVFNMGARFSEDCTLDIDCWKGFDFVYCGAGPPFEGLPFCGLVSPPNGINAPAYLTRGRP